MSFANPAFSQSDVETVAAKQKTETPIKHVIVLIGENRTFDHLFATYVSPSGDSVSNLLSEGIIKADGTPGRHFGKAKQFQAIAPFKKKYFISLDDDDKDAYGILPEPTLNFAPIPKPLPAGDLSFQPLQFFPPGTPTNLLAVSRTLFGDSRSGPVDDWGPDGIQPRLLFCPIRIRGWRISTRCRTGHFLCAETICHTTPIPATLLTGFSRCGSSLTAISRMPLAGIPQVALTISTPS